MEQPLVCLELCQFGDVYSYMKQWHDQESMMDRPRCVSDITVWKLFKDMSLGLDFLHNKHQINYVHTDFKVDNILVAAPQGWKPADGLPLEPVFKITDFARIMADPPLPGFPQEYLGTPEFASPAIEHVTPIHPAIDIWALGTTIQTFKTGLDCTVSNQTYILEMIKQGKPYPQINDRAAWKSIGVRLQRRTVYRPVNVSAAILRSEHDLPGIDDDYIPSSNSLEYAYRMLWRQPASERVTSAALVKDLVPRIDREIKILKLDARIEKALLKAEITRHKKAPRLARRLARQGQGAQAERI